MTLTHKLYAIALPVLLLSGCAYVDKTVNSIKEANTPEDIDHSVTKICQAARENPVRAHDEYVGKSLSFNGRLRAIEEGNTTRYSLRISVPRAVVHAGTDQRDPVKELNVGQAIKAAGVVTDVINDNNGCAIFLKDTHF